MLLEKAMISGRDGNNVVETKSIRMLVIGMYSSKVGNVFNCPPLSLNTLPPTFISMRYTENLTNAFPRT